MRRELSGRDWELVKQEIFSLIFYPDMDINERALPPATSVPTCGLIRNSHANKRWLGSIRLERIPTRPALPQPGTCAPYLGGKHAPPISAQLPFPWLSHCLPYARTGRRV